jgi:hypothetical protein
MNVKMKTLLCVLLMILGSLTVAHLKASDSTHARTAEGDTIKGFKTKAELDASLKAWDAVATFTQTDAIGESNDPEKKDALEKADKEASMSAFNIPPNIVVKILQFVKGKDEKDVDDYLILDPTSHGRKLWVCENDLSQMDGTAMGTVAEPPPKAFAGHPKSVISREDVYVPGYATKAQLDASQKADVDLTEFRKSVNNEYNNSDLVKKAALENAQSEASGSDYMIAPSTVLKVLNVVKNGKYFDDYLVSDPTFSNRQEWVNARYLLDPHDSALPIK